MATASLPHRRGCAAQAGGTGRDVSGMCGYERRTGSVDARRRRRRRRRRRGGEGGGGREVFSAVTLLGPALEGDRSAGGAAGAAGG